MSNCWPSHHCIVFVLCCVVLFMALALGVFYGINLGSCTCMCVSACLYSNVCVCVCTWCVLCMCVLCMCNVCTCICVCECVYVYECACACVYMHVRAIYLCVHVCVHMCRWASYVGVHSTHTQVHYGVFWGSRYEWPKSWIHSAVPERERLAGEVIIHNSISKVYYPIALTCIFCGPNVNSCFKLLKYCEHALLNNMPVYYYWVNNLANASEFANLKLTKYGIAISVCVLYNNYIIHVLLKLNS